MHSALSVTVPHFIRPGQRVRTTFGGNVFWNLAVGRFTGFGRRIGGGTTQRRLRLFYTRRSMRAGSAATLIFPQDIRLTRWALLTQERLSFHSPQRMLVVRDKHTEQGRNEQHEHHSSHLRIRCIRYLPRDIDILQLVCKRSQPTIR